MTSEIIREDALKKRLNEVTVCNIVKVKKIKSDNIVEVCEPLDKFLTLAPSNQMVLYSYEYYVPRKAVTDNVSYDDLVNNSIDPIRAQELKQITEEFKQIISKVDLDRPMRLLLAFNKNGVWFTLTIEDLWLSNGNNKLTQEERVRLSNLDPDFVAGELSEVR